MTAHRPHIMAWSCCGQTTQCTQWNGVDDKLPGSVMIKYEAKCGQRIGIQEFSK